MCELLAIDIQLQGSWSSSKFSNFQTKYLALSRSLLGILYYLIKQFYLNHASHLKFFLSRYIETTETRIEALDQNQYICENLYSLSPCQELEKLSFKTFLSKSNRLVSKNFSILCFKVCFEYIVS